MQRISAFLLMAGVSFSALVGCNNSGTPGGGTSATTDKKPMFGEADGKFHLSVSPLSTKLKQGETKVVTMSIERGKNSNDDVALTFVTPATGVTFEPKEPMIKHGDKEVKLTVKAADDAALGDFTVKVTGKPDKGEAASYEFKITIDKK